MSKAGVRIESQHTVLPSRLIITSCITMSTKNIKLFIIALWSCIWLNTKSCVCMVLRSYTYSKVSMDSRGFYSYYTGCLHSLTCWHLFSRTVWTAMNSGWQTESLQWQTAKNVRKVKPCWYVDADAIIFMPQCPILVNVTSQEHLEGIYLDLV